MFWVLAVSPTLHVQKDKMFIRERDAFVQTFWQLAFMKIMMFFKNQNTFFQKKIKKLQKGCHPQKANG